MSIDDIRLHPSTVQHSVNAVCSKILLADTFNDELFIDGASDSSVNEKYLYVVFAGTNSSYSTVAYDITMKYEFIIKPELKHVVQPAPSVAADNGLVKAAKQVAANLNNSDHPLVRHSMNNILGSFTDFFSRPLGRAAIGAGIATVAKSALTPNNLMKLSPLLLGCL